MATPGRSQSLPTAESSQGPSFGRRTQSDTQRSLHVPAPICPPPGTDFTTQMASAPSPAPTEIIPVDLTADEIVQDIQQMGIKVRDFAYENMPLDQRAPELFDPIMAWNQYEDALTNTDARRNAFSGRSMRRLLDLGWISEALDGSRWQKKDRDALEEFDSRPHYPWKAFGLPQPKKAKLKEAARARLQFVHVGQWPPEVLARGIARIGGFFRQGPASTSEKRPVDDGGDDEDGTEQQGEGSPRSKKQRTADGTPAVVLVHPPSMQHAPCTLVNGKPPQQFPAGRRPESPSRAAGCDSAKRTSASPCPDGSRASRPSGKPPKQYPAGYSSEAPPRPSLSSSPLGRPLQRQQTLSAIYTTDHLARSDSRTTLTESAKS
ncbi:hypothetical protein SCLCIDRAFT_1220967 [Scleroderma citrinum Foug A]|uniref:Uncharacterized protein n=1 Tax=Scleroderma citrinum Foug A TaxID=1036808 RepID=A0A0C3D4I9_9AGAM|nr:hypothetical protein SCLCIDRAFT_1220967 [Scleroderma citrinum Foug A]